MRQHSSVTVAAKRASWPFYTICFLAFALKIAELESLILTFRAFHGLGLGFEEDHFHLDKLSSIISTAPWEQPWSGSLVVSLEESPCLVGLEYSPCFWNVTQQIIGHRSAFWSVSKFILMYFPTKQLISEKRLWNIWFIPCNRKFYSC